MATMKRRDAIAGLLCITGGARLLANRDRAGVARRRLTMAPVALSPDSLGYPAVIQEAVAQRYPDWRLPRRSDLKEDWAEYFDLESLFPVLCRGNFFGNGDPSYAFFLLKGERAAVHVVRVRQNVVDVFHLDESDDLPQSEFVESLQPGTHAIDGSVLHEQGGPSHITLRYTGILRGTFESGSCLYYWNDAGRFDRQWMSD